jgi:hypothetical protein
MASQPQTGAFAVRYQATTSEDLTGPIVHIALFRWCDRVESAVSARIADRLRQMAAALPQIVSYRCGPDLGVADSSWDFAVVSVVRSAADLDGYLNHPTHREIVNDLVTPILAERAAVQARLSPDDPIATPRRHSAISMQNES